MEGTIEQTPLVFFLLGGGCLASLCSKCYFQAVYFRFHVFPGVTAIFAIAEKFGLVVGANPAVGSVSCCVFESGCFVRLSRGEVSRTVDQQRLYTLVHFDWVTGMAYPSRSGELASSVGWGAGVMGSGS